MIFYRNGFFYKIVRKNVQKNHIFCLTFNLSHSNYQLNE